jgi:hypothetical protein
LPARPHHFCTIVDEGFLLRALVFYRSLMEVSPDSHLFVACFDERSKALLDALSLPRCTTLSFEEIERSDPDLRGVKPSRSQAEYAQTAKPSVCLHVLAREPEIDHITFLDADLFFLHDPQPLFEELGEDSVLIVPHRRATAPEWTELYGIYNSGTVTFRRDERGLEALRWWRARCIEWCFQTPENGRYTDQRYLNDWPERFDGVHVLEHLGGGLAPWNGSQYSFEDRGGTVLVEGVPAIFYHFQSLQLYRGITTLRRLGLMSRTYRFTPRPVPLVWSYRYLYPVSSEEDRLFWQPYARRLSEGLLELRRVDPGFEAGFVDERAAARRELERRGRRRAKRVRRASRPTVRRVRRSWRQAAKGVRKRVRSARRGFLRAGGRVLRVFDR